jgi:hypothetical protein
MMSDDQVIRHADPSREFLRHALATLAYRSAKALRDAPESFSDFRPAPDARSAGQILAHMCDLFDWALSLAHGEQRWKDVPPQRWTQDSDRYFAALRAFDDYLSSDAPLGASAERLFQGPIADALTHTGQLTMMRRLANVPIRAENYAKADIVAGRVGASQAAPRAEFG